jgi:type VI secretion system protein ImpL
VLIVAVFVLVLVLVLVLLFFYWLRRQRTQKKDMGLRKNRLRRVYAHFLAPLPWRARSALRSYPWVVVLGDAGVGKTQLITSHVDWQGQKSQFFPSYTEDPLLQIYLGGRVVVQEVAAPLLADSSQAAQTALRRLWEPLCKRMPPTVLIVLSYRALRHSTPEQIRSHAQLLRGKVNLLSEILGAPVRTRVCLSYLDRQPGFAEFVRLLSQHHLPLSIPLRTESGELISLREGLTSYEKYLPLALTGLPSAEFRTLVEFLVHSPSVLSGVAESLRILGEEIAFSPTPAFDRLYLSAEGMYEKLPSPFYVRTLKPELLLHRLAGQPLGFLRALFDVTHVRAHIIGCTVVALLAALVYGMIYRGHTARIEAASEAVAKLEESVERARKSLNPPASSQAVRGAATEAGAKLLRLHVAEEGKPVLWRLAQEEKQAAKSRYLDAVRRVYLLPALEKNRQPQDRDRFIYALGALYASRNGTLGAELRRAPAPFTAATAAPEDVLQKYAELSDEAWAERIPAAGPLPWKDPAQSPAMDLAPWLSYLTVLDATFSGDVLSRGQLLRLQQVTRRFSEGLAEAQKNHAAERILRILSEESPVDLTQLFGPSLSALMPPVWLFDNSERLGGLFQMILSSSLEPPRSEQLQLGELMSLLTPPQGQPDAAKKKDTVYAFELSGRSFRYSSLRWQELLATSRRRELLDSIIGGGGHRAKADKVERPDKKKAGKHRRRHRHRHEAAASADVAPIRARESAAHELPGSDSIPSEYTRAGFEKQMKPHLETAEKRLAAAPLSPEQRQDVARVLLAQARRYAKNYRDAQLSYLLGYRPHGESLVDIVGMLTELLQPTSPLLGRLLAIADNAALGPLPGPYFAPMNEQLPALAPLSRLATQKDGAYPEYDKYKAIIAQLIRDVSSSAPDAPATGIFSGGGAAPNPPADAKAQKQTAAQTQIDAPSGAARVAIAVLQGQEGSPLRQIEAFLDAAGIVGDLRKPFLAPLLRVYRLGLHELEASIEKRYAQEYARHIAPLLSRFPFDRSAKTEVTPEALAALRPPDGAFFTFIARQVAPLCSASELPDKGLRPLRGPLGSVKLPEELLSLVGRLRRLAQALWTSGGEEQPIALSVKPLPLPPRDGAASKEVVTQTYLSCSNVTVYGYNQMPEARPFPLPWWRQENSAVGLELGSADSKARHYRSIDVNNSTWSFYRLLSRADWTEGHVAVWTLPADGQTPLKVRFAFDKDPFAIFDLTATRGRGKAAESQAESMP